MKLNHCVHRSFLTATLVGGLLLLPNGCGFFDNTGTVSGTVRYKEQPLSEGSVSFVSETGQVMTAAIAPSGRYVVSRVPLGPAKVTVQVVSSKGPPPVSFAPIPTAPSEPGTTVQVPRRYSMAATSDLRHTVTKGNQQFDIELRE